MQEHVLQNMGKTENLIIESREVANLLENEGCHELAQAARDVANSFEKINNHIIAEKQSVLQ